MRADIAGLPLETPAVTEATAAGAALLAAWGAGIVPAGAYPPALTEPGRRYVPDGSLSAAYAAGYDRYRSLFAALRPLYRTAESGAGARIRKGGMIHERTEKTAPWRAGADACGV